MTGLDAKTDRILQVALVVTNAELEPLEEYACDVWQPPEALLGMTPFVREMHEKNGLLERVRASRVDLHRAEQDLLTRIAGWCAYPAMLCGNSIGHDKHFLEHWMPGLAGYLHYRTLDVSAIKVVSRLWYGSAGVYPKPTDREHDALFDIHQSIAEFAFYRERVFRAR